MAITQGIRWDGDDNAANDETEKAEGLPYGLCVRAYQYRLCLTSEQESLIILWQNIMHRVQMWATNRIKQAIEEATRHSPSIPFDPATYPGDRNAYLYYDKVQRGWYWREYDGVLRYPDPRFCRKDPARSCIPTKSDLSKEFSVLYKQGNWGEYDRAIPYNYVIRNILDRVDQGRKKAQKLNYARARKWFDSVKAGWRPHERSCSPAGNQVARFARDIGVNIGYQYPCSGKKEMCLISRIDRHHALIRLANITQAEQNEIGRLRVRYHRRLPRNYDQVRMVSITNKADGWYLSLVVWEKEPRKLPPNDITMGVDLRCARDEGTDGIITAAIYDGIPKPRYGKFLSRVEFKQDDRQEEEEEDSNYKDLSRYQKDQTPYPGRMYVSSRLRSRRDNERNSHLQAMTSKKRKVQPWEQEPDPNSRRTQKRKATIRKLHQRTARRRKENTEHVANRITDQAQHIKLEDIIWTDLVEEGQPQTKDNPTAPGRKANTKLNTAILDASPGMIREHIVRKAREKGRKTIIIPCQYTTLRCNACGTIHPGKSKDMPREWTCENCGKRNDKFMNAAMNIWEAPEATEKRKKQKP